MNIDFQRNVDRHLGAAICRLLSLFHRVRTARPPGPVRRVLVILLSEMGSLVLAYPMFQRVRKRFPGAEIHVLVFEKNREVLDILGVIPKEHVLTLRDGRLLPFVRDGLSAVFRLRRLRPEVVIDCELFSRVSSIFSFLSGAGLRVGFHPHTQEGLYRGDFINRPVLYNPYNHMSRQFLTLAAAVDAQTTPMSKAAVDPEDAETLNPPAVAFPPEVIRRARMRLDRDFPAVGTKPLVLLYPGGGVLPIRAWPLDHFCRVSTGLIAAGCAVGVVGLAGDRPLARRIQAATNDPCCIDLTGYTASIRELMHLFHAACLLITNDGGPGQFAAMTPLPTIVLYGPETPVLYGPLDPKATVFFNPLPCSPCLTAYNHRKSPCDGDNRCLKRIAPEPVLEKALEILGRLGSENR